MQMRTMVKMDGLGSSDWINSVYLYLYTFYSFVVSIASAPGVSSAVIYLER